jgi:hypothetical protein
MSNPSPDPNPVAIDNPGDLIAVIPSLIGIQPNDGDLVIIAVHHNTIVMAGYAAIGDLHTKEQRHAALRTFAAPISHADVDAAVVVGYGSPDPIGPAITGLAALLTTHGIVLIDLLRVANGRYYTHMPSPPAHGVPFDTATTTTAAAKTLPGSVPPPDRAALADQLAPIEGAERKHMHAATVRARHRLQHITAVAANAPAVLEDAGRNAATNAYQRHRAGERLTDDEAAWLTVLLTHIPVRDHVWSRTYGHDAHLTLWTDLTRRAEPDLAAAPASLLAFTAWRMGNGALAAVAIRRALDTDPGYQLARSLAGAIFNGMPPSIVDQHFHPDDDPLADRSPTGSSTDKR